MIGCAYHLIGEVERVGTGLRPIAVNTYMIDCKVCGKSVCWYGKLENYRYVLRAWYTTERGNHSYRKAYCCSWSCYIKALLKSTAEKQLLDAQDVILLLRYQQEVPWDRVAKVAWQQLPAREDLEGARCYLR